jgi:hypothetical protein
MIARYADRKWSQQGIASTDDAFFSFFFSGLPARIIWALMPSS